MILEENLVYGNRDYYLLAVRLYVITNKTIKILPEEKSGMKEANLFL